MTTEKTDAAAEKTPTPTPERAPARRSLLTVPLAELAQSRDLMRQALDELEEKTRDLGKQRDAIAAELARTATQCQVLTRMMERMPGQDGPRTEIRDYLNRSVEVRQRKAEAAQRFLATAGTTAAAVAEALQPRSKLDAAMSRRKQDPASRRPRQAGGS